MADGSIEFSTKLDNAQLEKDLRKVEKQIDTLKQKIEQGEQGQTAIEEEMIDARLAIEDAEAAADALRKKLAEVKAASASGSVNPLVAEEQVKVYEARIAEINSEIEGHNARLGELQGQWDKANEEIVGYQAQLKQAESRQNELVAATRTETVKSRWSDVARNIRARMAETAEGIRARFTSAARTSAAQLQGQMSGALRRIAAIGIAAIGIRAIGSEMLKIANQNEQFSAGVQQLKAVLTGFASGILTVIMPALNGFIGLVIGIVESIASLIDALFGSNLSGSIAAAKNAVGGADAANDMADAQDRQAKSAKNLAKEQKKANAQVMGFDELNKLAADSSDGAGGGYTPSGGGGGGGALADFAPDLSMFDGLFDWLDELKNRILNDVEGPFARIREGIQLIKKGWDEIVQGIQTGNWALVWKGIGDIVIGALYVIEGAFSALMDWLNDMTGGKFSETFEGLKNIVHGAVEFIEGLLRGDLPLAFQGLMDIITGIAQVANGTVNAAFGLLRGGVEAIFAFLGEKFPELQPMFEGVKDAFVTVLNAIEAIFHGVIDGAKTFLQGALDFIVGLFTLDGDRILSGVKTMGDGIGKVFEGIWNAIVTIMTPINNWLSQNVFGPMETAFNDAFNAAVRAAEGAWNGICNAFSSVASFFGEIFGNAWEAVKRAFSKGGQVFDGLVGAVTKAFKSLGNNVIDGLNWAISQPFNGLNSIIRALNGWQILDIYPFNFPTLDVPRIPHLAAGAVIPPNREFMAVLGDQSNGRNLEAPESLMRQIVKDETSAAIASLASLLSGGNGDVSLVLNVDGEQLAMATERGRASAARRGMIKPSISFT